MHGILRPLKEVTAAVAMALGADVDLGDILWSRTGREGGGWRIGKRKEPSGRESRTNHAETHGLGAAVRKIEGDTPRRARAQPNSCVPLEGNPRRSQNLHAFSWDVARLFF